jgi:catechol 2,3-dioxygenase-like lactoylglutathione lyase family enzyme
MNVLFVASVAVVASDPPRSRELYVDALGLPLEGGDGDEYVHSEKIDGSKHFGVWPLSQAARACFGVDEWPADRPVPQVSIEFEVEDAAAVAAAAHELEEKGSSSCTARGRSRGARPSPGCSRSRARSSASRTPRGSTRRRDCDGWCHTGSR